MISHLVHQQCQVRSQGHELPHTCQSKIVVAKTHVNYPLTLFMRRISAHQQLDDLIVGAKQVRVVSNIVLNGSGMALDTEF